MENLKTPPGIGLLLVGSGLYWVLAGPLIGWFSVLNPLQIRLSQLGLSTILLTGIVCLASGLWIIPEDLERLRGLFSRNDGWIFTIPILLVVSDIYLTLFGLSHGGWELNPYVATAIGIGYWAMIPFVISYMVLSEGVALVMLGLGKWLFGVAGLSRYVPYALVCGVASLGLVSNAESLALSEAGSWAWAYSLSVPATIVAVSVGIFSHFRRTSS